MSKFSVEGWVKVLNQYTNSGSLERRGLRHIHERHSLDELALTLRDHLEYLEIKAAVQVSSIWIDGTPQAKADIKPKGSVQCELADLMIILSVTQNNIPLRESALLIQGKVGNDPETIPTGSSTTRERALLEHFDDSSPLEIYKNTRATSLIDKFDIKTGSVGFKNHARFLVMPINLNNPVVRDYGPFVSGWPKAHKSHKLTEMCLFADTPVLMWEFLLGSPITDPSKDEWTRLVRRLSGHYKFRSMKRFGGFSRKINSAKYMSYLSICDTDTYMTFNFSPSSINFFTDTDYEDEYQPPLIPVIRVIVDIQNEREDNFVHPFQNYS